MNEDHDQTIPLVAFFHGKDFIFHWFTHDHCKWWQNESHIVHLSWCSSGDRLWSFQADKVVKCVAFKSAPVSRKEDISVRKAKCLHDVHAGPSICFPTACSLSNKLTKSQHVLQEQEARMRQQKQEPKVAPSVHGWLIVTSSFFSCFCFLCFCWAARRPHFFAGGCCCLCSASLLPCLSLPNVSFSVVFLINVGKCLDRMHWLFFFGYLCMDGLQVWLMAQ